MPTDRVRFDCRASEPSRDGEKAETKSDASLALFHEDVGRREIRMPPATAAMIGLTTAIPGIIMHARV